MPQAVHIVKASLENNPDGDTTEAAVMGTVDATPSDTEVEVETEAGKKCGPEAHEAVLAEDGGSSSSDEAELELNDEEIAVGPPSGSSALQAL